nr:hypothetical protein BaRGS_004256 [Batillaria attramentaria]
MSTPTQEEHSFGIRNALDTVNCSGSTECPNISPARPQRNARNPTGTGHVDKFPRPKPRDRTEFSPEAMEKMVDSFDENPYPGIDERVRLATLAGVEEGRIQSPVGSAGEPAKESIDLNDTVFVDVEGDVSDTEKHIDMRDSGFGSSADISL